MSTKHHLHKNNILRYQKNMADSKNKQFLLESMIGVPVSRNAGVQIPVDANLPIKFSQLIHYELYKNHVELHVESSSYPSLCSFLNEHLPDNDSSETVQRSFCKYAYMLKRRVDGWSNIEELGGAFIELRCIVEPILFQYCEMIADNLDLAHALGEYYESQINALPFHINVIDQLHANENAHTRILTQLLKYREEGHYTILKSFLQLLPDFDINCYNIDNSCVFFNRENIDGLIEKEGEYAVIIENKIHGAVDQDKQIERYVHTKFQHGIPLEHIWVIYLTRDGLKKVENYSLSPKTAKILGSRFVELNYRHHILPWLKDSILPNCRMKEEWLVSAIKQYVDHLEGLFGVRDSQKTLRNNLRNKIVKSIGCTETMSIGDKYAKMTDYRNILNDLQNIVAGCLESLVKPVVNRMEEETTQILGEICPDVDVKFYNGLDNGYFQILFKNCWPNSIHFEWIPMNKESILKNYEYSITLHVEGNLQDRMRKLLTDEAYIKEAAHVGLGLHSDNRTFFRYTISTQKPIAEMSQTELHNFLYSAYKNVAGIKNFITNRFLNYK